MNKIFKLATLFVIAVIILACSIPSGLVRTRPVQPASPAQGPSQQAPTPKIPRNVVFSIPEGIQNTTDKLFSITFDAAKPATVEKNNGKDILILHDAVIDFILPASKLASLKRSDIGGKELINQVEVYYDPAANSTAFIIRFATAGQGKGMGNIGLSVAAGFNLSGNQYTPILTSGFSAQNGKTSTGSACIYAEDHAKSDLLAVGKNAQTYTSFLGGETTDCYYYYGFVLYDVLASPNEPYFELNRGINEVDWDLTPKP
jgi:hypothetical protein